MTTSPIPTPEVAEKVFGDRTGLAVRYVEHLATSGIERGLIGPRERILDPLEAWKVASAKRHVTTLVAKEASPEALRLLAEELL